MWIPSHNRRDRGCSPGLTFAFCFTILFAGGCAALPQFGGRQPHAIIAPEDLPPPVFDLEDEPQKIASAGPIMGLVAAPEPFAWKTLSNTADGRSIEGITAGQGGYRTLVLGSLAGDDPLAIQLTEKLAEHVHNNQIILGGIEATFVRNPNPDGAANYRMENGNGVYLNRQFTTSLNPKMDLQKQEPEIRFLLGVLDERQPQRVIHIRTTSKPEGRIAASSESASVAKDVCSWLDFGFIELPGNSAIGTLERFLSEKDSCEIVTFAIPQTSDKSTLWEDYGDSLLNLLLAEDFQTRKLARQNKGSVAADRRGKKHRSGSNSRNGD